MQANASRVVLLEERKVPVEDLVINRKLSKKVSDYRKDIVQAIVSRQLATHGRELDAGEPVGYVITDFYNKRAEKRAAAIDLLQGYDYDVRKYLEMLIDSANTILNPFGITDPLQCKILGCEDAQCLYPCTCTYALYDDNNLTHKGGV